MTFDELLTIPPYSLDHTQKAEMLTERLGDLTRLHKDKCEEYARILEGLSLAYGKIR